MSNPPTDTAKTFRPHTILLWNKVAQHPEARRIVNMFPDAQVRIVERQRSVPVRDHATTHALVVGKRTLMIGEASSFVHRFDGGLGGNVRCRPYFKLVPVSNGCPYYCTYCYLAYVYREHLPAIKVNINHDKMFTEIRKAIAGTSGQTAFNMGEMLDSLALDHVTNLTSELVPFFASLRRGYLMLLTKSANIDNLLRLEPNRQTVVSWSLNSQPMIEAYEPGTAALVERIEAARRCQRHGYRVRFRIDPGILYAEWRPSYAEVVQRALEAVEPENVTLGMLRLVPGHFGLAARAYGKRGRDLRQHDLVESTSDGKLRYRTQRRVEFYRFMIDAIRSFNQDVSISLCRETPNVCSHFTHVCNPQRCNCLAW